MEAVPKVQLLSFELKVSPESTHFGPKLKQYIAEAYREDPDSYGNELHQLEGLRSAAVRPTIDSAGLCSLTRYFCQLRAMQSRFPMNKGQPAACTFAWKDLYANMNCSLADIKFEMACILYNIGALHTQLGSSEPRNSPDSLKVCCQHFQHAAWAFQQLREQYPQPSGADLCHEIVRLLQEICYAQAQECILEKSIQDTRKSSVIGSVATQVLHFYKSSFAMLGPTKDSESVNEIVGQKLHNFWYRYISFKMSYVGSIVCLYQGMNAEEQQKMGERLAYYQLAVDRLGEARKLAKYIEPVQVTQEALTFTNDVIEGKKKAAKNENEFIYHEEVPDKDLLSELKPVCLVKPVPINFNDPEISGPDIFSRLVPIGAHEASSLYSEEKAKLLRHVIGLTDAKNTELTEFMSSLQLDQLDVLDSDQKIPQEIVDRCAAMNAKSEIIQTLVDSMNSLAEIISDVEHSLEEIKTLIQEETMKEKEYQKQMGPRPPSIVQTEISREYHKYQEAHLRTNESNQVLHKAMTLHIANLRLLSQPLEVLEHKIPSIENIEGLDRDSMKEMRRVVGKAREMQRQRDGLVQQLRAAVAADDVTAQLLQRPQDPPDEIFKAELEKHTPTVKIIEQNLAAQENIINKLTSLYASYGDSRRLLSEVLRKREGLINALITSYDSHAELLGKSQKGLEFYRKLAHNVGGLLARLRSVCQVHREERAQMMARQEAPKSTPSSAAKVIDAVPTPASGAPLKLKDYLPYMKNRGMARGSIPQVQPEALPADTYYPETIYPTSVRPTPVGSEATELTPPSIPDGVVMPQMQNVQNPYAKYGASYGTDSDTYAQVKYAHPSQYIKPEDIHSPYTPSQYSTQMTDPQIYTNPYYSATNNTTTSVTESQDSYSNQTMAQPPTHPTQYNPYMQNPANIPEQSTSMYNPVSQDFNASFSQMQISAKPDPNSQDYSQTYYSVQYPQMYTSNTQTYSNAGQKFNTNTTGQMSNEYSSNYPYTSGTSTQLDQNAVNSPAVPDMAYSASSVPGQNVPSSYAAMSQSTTNVTNQMQNINTANNAMAYPNTFNQTPNSAVQNDPYSYSNISQVQNPSNSMMNITGQNVSVAGNSGVEQNPSITNQMSNYANYTSVQQAMPNVSNPASNVAMNMNVSASMPYVSNPYSVEQQYSFANAYDNVSQPYVYSTVQNSVTTTTNANTTTFSTGQTYMQNEPSSYVDPNLSQFDALDKPIKSHVTGQALSNMPSMQQYSSVGYQTDQSISQVNQPNVHQSNQQNYGQTFQDQNTNQVNQPNLQQGNQQSYGQTFQDQSSSQVNQPNLQQGNQQNYGQTFQDQSSSQVNQPSLQQSNQQNYGQTFQNHPGYTFNPATGAYEYTYGSQNSYTSYDTSQTNLNQSVANEQNFNTHGVYSSAGTCETMQSPSENPQQNTSNSDNNQIYYNLPYGYQTVTNQSYEPSPSMPVSTNYGANMNNSTYMQSGQAPDTSVTYASNDQVQTQKESVSQPSNVETTQSTSDGTTKSVSQGHEKKAELPAAPTLDQQSEPSTFDLLSDIDFTVEQKPLTPDIKVPQISEKVIVKPTVIPKVEPVKPNIQKEEVIERPPKKDLFADPSLLNKFTQEVKDLQRLTDTLSIKTSNGLTVLESKWKTYQDIQVKENSNRSKKMALKHTRDNIVTAVVPYDDSRLTLKSDSDVYINATYYKQLSPWCIPLVIAKCPNENETAVFWKAVLENKIACIICLQTEIEMQGEFYWPTAKGQSLELRNGPKVTLEEVKCNVHWTERKLRLSLENTELSVTHYQINVYPAKVVCSPLVLLADRTLGLTYEGRDAPLTACVQCGAGAGRSVAFALLLLAMCQVRAGYPTLIDTLDMACMSLARHRTNVMEDPKFLADAYRTVLFYAQGVLCSGTTSFNGETVAVPSGASVLPPTPVTPAPSSSSQRNKFSRESFEEMKQAPGLKSGDMKDPLNFLDPLWSLKKK
ncbi:tyrosine-protein phosphatase non-receptor type 23 [Aricia agestis]|uniref:tyrosine-protein phosphatase non-receptor type 23 n=1 Tax=Aricia agestis TaxID=91739 RepID=UPI001C207153|nr:tyrosine-protein phosphatase non-receptor type 23 [Aricia agestis]